MMLEQAKTYRNLLEPSAILELFLRFPPEGFICALNTIKMPVFHTVFDLLTTLEPDKMAKLRQAPLYSVWSKWLRLATCFAGSTVTEYAPVPAALSPEELLAKLLNEHCKQQSLTIVKDLPDASPLLCAEDNAFADKLAQEAVKRGFISVAGQALAYVPIDFRSVEEYLSRLSSSRRKDLRRKMKKREQLAIEVISLGDTRFSAQALLDECYAMYLEVFKQSEIHFDLLRADFFTALLQSRETPGVVFCYRYGEKLVGYNICLIHQGSLVDKYIGFKYTIARELNLYFISWKVNLEFALKNVLNLYIAGWTDPEVKARLGAKFTLTRHLVWVKNPLLRHILYLLRHLFEADARAIAANCKT
jgi:predicted N-acyltransferase